MVSGKCRPAVMLFAVILAVGEFMLDPPDHDIARIHALSCILVNVMLVSTAWEVWLALRRREYRSRAFASVRTLVYGLAAGWVAWLLLAMIWPIWWKDALPSLMVLSVFASAFVCTRYSLGRKLLDRSE